MWAPGISFTNFIVNGDAGNLNTVVDVKIKNVTIGLCLAVVAVFLTFNNGIR